MPIATSAALKTHHESERYRSPAGAGCNLVIPRETVSQPRLLQRLVRCWPECSSAGQHL